MDEKRMRCCRLAGAAASGVGTGEGLRCERGGAVKAALLIFLEVHARWFVDAGRVGP